MSISPLARLLSPKGLEETGQDDPKGKAKEQPEYESLLSPGLEDNGKLTY